MNGKKLFQSEMREINKLTNQQKGETLAGLLMEKEARRIKRVEAVKKCNVKRYASLKRQKELEEENKSLMQEIERLERELKDVKQLKGFKESKQIKEIKTEGGYFDINDVPEYEELENEERYKDDIEKLLIALGKHIGFEDDLSFLYLDILRENGLKQAKKYPIAEKREKEYKKIIEAIKKEFD
jgi:hypothetical protein